MVDSVADLIGAKPRALAVGDIAGVRTQGRLGYMPRDKIVRNGLANRVK